MMAATLVLILPNAKAAASGPSSETVDGRSDTLETDTQRLERELFFRAQFGLSTDPELVEDLESDNTARERGEGFGVPLTADERKVLDTRFAAEGDIADLRTALQALDGYAGFYVDQARGEIVVLSTDDQSDAWRTATGRTIGAMPVVVKHGEHSAKELRTINDQLVKDWMTDQVANGVTGVGIDERANRVRVTVERNTSGTALAFLDPYGSAVALEEVPEPLPMACNGRGDCKDPLRAGLRIVNGTVGGSCASGFLASSPAGGNTYMFTAGHCYHGSFGLLDTGYGIGNVATDSFFDGSYADAETIDITNSQESNYIYKTSSSVYTITGRQTPATDYVGQPVCVSSWYYGANCGSITYTTWNTFYLGKHFIDQRRANYYAHSGDSGNAVWIGQTTKAEGLTVSGNSDHDCFFSQIVYAETYQQMPNGLQECRNLTCS
jgi:hypothetical protein